MTARVALARVAADGLTTLGPIWLVPVTNRASYVSASGLRVDVQPEHAEPVCEGAQRLVIGAPARNPGSAARDGACRHGDPAV